MSAIRREAAFATAAALLSCQSVFYRLVYCGLAPELAENSPETLIAGLGSTPYQYRALVPMAVRGLLEAGVVAPGSERLVLALIEAIAWLLLGYAFRRLLRGFMTSAAIASACALSIYFVLPFHYFNQVFFPYDIPSVLLFTTGLVLLRERRWGWYALVFAVATLNRETSIFLTLAFLAVFAGEYSRQRLAAGAASQLLVWAAIKIGLWLLYSDNATSGPGLFAYQLRVNLATIFEAPLAVIGAMSVFGATWIAVLGWRHRIADRFLMRLLLVTPVFVAGMLIVGFVVEKRIYGEVVPIILSAFWVGFADAVRGTNEERRTKN